MLGNPRVGSGDLMRQPNINKNDGGGIMSRWEAYGQGLNVGDKIKVQGKVFAIHCMYDRHCILVADAKYTYRDGRLYKW